MWTEDISTAPYSQKPVSLMTLNLIITSLKLYYIQAEGLGSWEWLSSPFLLNLMSTIPWGGHGAEVWELLRKNFISVLMTIWIKQKHSMDHLIIPHTIFYFLFFCVCVCLHSSLAPIAVWYVVGMKVCSEWEGVSVLMVLDGVGRHSCKYLTPESKVTASREWTCFRHIMFVCTHIAMFHKQYPERQFLFPHSSNNGIVCPFNSGFKKPQG